MNEIDWVILAVLAISTVLGVSRGVVREILAIVGWVLGIVLALKFA
ncbi:MAG: CvpA family protein, partial [Duodenibacillus sp.]|nr:CvpA family protein [Duodenibacillus sp.]